MTYECIVCSEKKFSAIYNNSLLKCNKCEFITANTNITKETLYELYSEKYFKGNEYADYIADKTILQKNFSNRLSFALNKVDKKEITNALEIGCAYGFFAETLTNTIPHTNYIGYDISKDAVKYGKAILGQNLISEDYPVAPPPINRYTDVFMWDVIEHLPDPDCVINKISKEIIAGGRLYITTGDIESLIPKFQKENWRLIHPPTHLHYFSERTLRLLLEKNGFEISYIKYPSILRSIRFIFYSLFILNKTPNKAIHKIYNLIPEKLWMPFNSFDIMYVIAIRKRV